MRLIYTNENRLLVANVRNLLEASGIGVSMKNEFAAGGAGELSPFEVWPEVWVTEDSDYEQAVRLLDSSLSASDAPSWLCANCGEHNDASFELCWQCGRDRPANTDWMDTPGQR